MSLVKAVESSLPELVFDVARALAWSFGAARKAVQRPKSPLPLVSAALEPLAPDWPWLSPDLPWPAALAWPLALGTETDTCDKASDTAVWAGAGRLPVAAAATPVDPSTAPAAMAATFSERSLVTLDLLPDPAGAGAGFERTASTPAATIAASRASSSGAAALVATQIKPATAA